jgi:hypothetical protein
MEFPHGERTIVPIEKLQHIGDAAVVIGNPHG